MCFVIDVCPEPANRPAPFRLPAEWEPQSAIQITWPGPDSPWGKDTPRVEDSLAMIVAAIANHEQTIIIAAENAEHCVKVLHRMAVNMAYVHIYTVKSNDSWARDHGGITVMSQSDPLILDFSFTGWGGKYPADRDNLLTQSLAQCGAFGDTPIHPLDFVLEGGAIDSDGNHTLLTTASCLLNPNRYPNVTPNEIAGKLSSLLGVKRVIFLEHGMIAGDDTDGHVDTLARFCSPDTIAYAICERDDEAHYASLQAMEAELMTLRTQDGAPYKLIPLPMPEPIRDEDGNQLPATYANFLITNEAVLVPTYLDPYDEVAMGRLQDCFPDRAIVGIDCTDIIRQYGSLHCLTMQYPIGVVPD